MFKNYIESTLIIYKINNSKILGLWLLLLINYLQ